MSKKYLFSCAECGGDVVATRGPGRFVEYRRGVMLPVPADFEMPICADCGEQYSNVQRSERLSKLQKPAYDAWLRVQAAKLIKYIQAEANVTLANLEYACGVSNTYFSRLQSGKHTPSLALVRLLEAFANYPAELARHRKGETWQPAAPASVNIMRTWAARPPEATRELIEQGEVYPLPTSPAAHYTSSSVFGLLATPSNDNIAA